MITCSIKTIWMLAIGIVLTCSIFLTSLSIAPAVRADTPHVQAGEALEPPDLTITAIKPYHHRWSEEHSLAMGEPYFNLQNYVNVTVRNNGTVTAEEFDVALYADGELIGRETIAELSAGEAWDLRFAWTPGGEDPLSWTDMSQGAKLAYQDTNRNYTLRAVADEEDEVQELNETNNELTTTQKVVWNGYAADQPLEVYAHGVVRGGVIVTTGDAIYRSDGSSDSGTVYGKPYEITYPVQIPGSPKLARFYIYYTWAEPRSSKPKAPKIRVTLRISGGSSADVPLDASYNDVKGDLMSYKYHAWGTYAYDLTKYLKASGTYVVTIENVNDGSDTDFTTKYSFAAPAMLILYENQTAPKREYWITEGADILMGGREQRSEGGYLGLDSCRNRAEFTGEHLDQEVEKAVVGVISPWADDAEDDVLEFNGIALGKGLYNGYYNAWRGDLAGLSMEVGDEAQQGAVALDVTRYLDAEDNEVVQGDDGDNMMPATAVLVITYKDEAEEDGSSAGSSAKVTATESVTPKPSGAAPAATMTRAVRMIPRLEADKEVTMIFPDMDVSLLTLKADTNLSDARVRVARVKKPYALPEPPGIPYVYLNLQVEHEQDTASIAGRIEFRVAEAWLTANDIDESSVTLYRYQSPTGWTALPTCRGGDEANSSRFFLAATPAFSIFAVTGVETAKPEQATLSPTTTEPKTLRTTTPAPTATGRPDTPSEVPDGVNTPGFEALAGTVGMLALFYQRRWRSRCC